MLRPPVVVIPPTSSGSGFYTQLNNNFALLADALENALDRFGSAPNQMESDLDMNSFRIINCADPINPSDVVTLRFLINEIGKLVAFTEIKWQGPWTTGKFYPRGSLVHYEGSVYYANVDHVADLTNGPTASNTSWSLFLKSYNLKGNWSSGTVYEYLDVVSYNGSSYVTFVTHTADANNEPEVGPDWSNYWQLVVSKPTLTPGSVKPEHIDNTQIFNFKDITVNSKAIPPFMPIDTGFIYLTTGQYTAFSQLLHTNRHVYLVAYDSLSHVGDKGKVIFWKMDEGAGNPVGPFTIHEHPTYDVRFGAAGVRQDGALVVGVCYYDISTAAVVDTKVLISEDDGLTWNGHSVATGWFPNGKIIDVGGTLIMSAYGGGYTAAVFKSVDGGVTWTGPNFIAPSNSFISETDILHLGGATLIAVSRTENDPAGGTTYLTFKQYVSFDLGDTWTYLGEIFGDTWATTAGTPPCLVNLGDGQIMLVYMQRTLGILRARFISCFDATVTTTTWSDPVDLEGGFSVGLDGYPSAIVNPTNSGSLLIAVYKETSPSNSGIRIRHFNPVSDIQGNESTFYRYTFKAPGTLTTGHLTCRLNGNDIVGYSSPTGTPFVVWNTNMGIQTATPVTTLDVNGTFRPGIFFSASGLPNAASMRGALIFYGDTNEFIYSDGVNWRYVKDGTLV